MHTQKRPYSFSAAQRLCEASDYGRVFDHSRRVSARNLIALAADNSIGYARLGLAISRKHVKSAVKRNYIKRIVREFFRHNKQNLGSLDIVVLSCKQTSGAQKKHLAEALQTLRRELLIV